MYSPETLRECLHIRLAMHNTWLYDPSHSRLYTYDTPIKDKRYKKQELHISHNVIMGKAFFDNGIVSSITTTLNDKNIAAFLNDPAQAKTRSVAIASLFTVITAYAISRVSHLGANIFSSS